MADTSQTYTVRARWTSALVEQGFTPVSDFFLANYQKLDPPISYAEAMLIIHLISHKWTASAPFPGFKSLASRMGVSDATARSYARSLERKGYLKRTIRTGTTNKFHLQQLFSALEKLQAEQSVEAEAGLGADPEGGSIVSVEA